MGWGRDPLVDVTHLLDRAVAAGMAPGFVGLVVHDDSGGRSWFAGSCGVGLGPVDADVRFDLASLTKPLATATLLLLARRDGLDLDTPLADLLPELSASPFASARVWQAAAHCAGFPAWAPLYALGERTRAGYLDSLARLEPAGPPGSQVVYSCPGFITLGLALERAGEADLATLFDELVAGELGLSEELGYAPREGTPVAAGEREWFVERALLAALGLPGEPPTALADRLSCGDGNTRALGGVGANAGLFGTAAAVAQLAAEYLPGGGDLLTADEAELATRCWTPGLEQARGLGWQLAATPECSAGAALPASAFGHTGYSGTSVWVDPESRRIYVLLGNRLNPGGLTPDLHPLRRRFHQLVRRGLCEGESAPRIGE
jgi:CubicO group peptidase (beta-lactamase class C family)